MKETPPTTTAGVTNDDGDSSGTTRLSWNVATRAHNAHKRDQAAFLRAGGSTLFTDEVELVGDLQGRSLLHVCCNSGQDTLSWARAGAVVTGIDFSDEAIAFARRLSSDSGISATFEQSEAIAWLEGSANTYDVVCATYGVLGWFKDLPRLLRGMARATRPGGRLVLVEFHPLVWTFSAGLDTPKDPYFAPGHAFHEPVGDYVGAAGGALSPSGHVGGDEVFSNPHDAVSWQHTVGDILQAAIDAGLVLDVVRELPWANGCKVIPELEAVDGNRFVMPAHRPSLPLMLALTAYRPV